MIGSISGSLGVFLGFTQIIFDYLLCYSVGIVYCLFNLLFYVIWCLQHPQNRLFP